MKRSELAVVFAVHGLPRRLHTIDARERVAHRKAARDVVGAIDLAAGRAMQGGTLAAHGAQIFGHHLGRGSVIGCIHNVEERLETEASRSSRKLSTSSNVLYRPAA